MLCAWVPWASNAVEKAKTLYDEETVLGPAQKAWVRL